MFKLSQLILYLPHGSYADDERVFSYVRKNRTDFRASLSNYTLSGLLRCKVNLFSQTSCYQWQSPREVLKSARLATSAAVKKHEPITRVRPWYWHAVQYYIASYNGQAINRRNQVYRTAVSLKFPLLLFGYIKKFKVLLWPDDWICLFKYTFILNYYMSL